MLKPSLAVLRCYPHCRGFDSLNNYLHLLLTFAMIEGSYSEKIKDVPNTANDAMNHMCFGSNIFSDLTTLALATFSQIMDAYGTTKYR